MCSREIGSPAAVGPLGACVATKVSLSLNWPAHHTQTGPRELVSKREPLVSLEGERANRGQQRADHTQGQRLRERTEKRFLWLQVCCLTARLVGAPPLRLGPSNSRPPAQSQMGLAQMIHSKCGGSHEQPPPPPSIDNYPGLCQADEKFRRLAPVVGLVLADCTHTQTHSHFIVHSASGSACCAWPSLFGFAYAHPRG